MPPRRGWIDKKSAKTFQLVYRPQNDPRIHDSEASDMVFKEVAAPNVKGEIKNRFALEDELDLGPDGIRDNEGEAANYGIFYDDTEYDYMQHMRDVGGSGETVFIEAPQPSAQRKGKGKQKLEDALREASLDDKDEVDSDGGVKLEPSKNTLLEEETVLGGSSRKLTYQDQQDIPDVLAGFQPDMDPRLREVLEALDDDAYVDYNDEDIFEALAGDGEEVSVNEFEETDPFDELDEFGENEDGWESDDTAKPTREYKDAEIPNLNGSEDPASEHPGDQGDGDWMKEFSKFKKAEKSQKEKAPPSNSDLLSSIMTGSSITGGRHKKRKGAMTSTSGYSMTSSSLFRTEGMTLLDERFDKIEEQYAEDDMDDDVSVATGTSMASQGPIRHDFDSIMDDFLGGHSIVGKGRVKKGARQTGMEQLDEIRQGLGPARVKSQKA